MTTPTDQERNDDLLKQQGILEEVQHQAEVAIAEDLEEDRLTQNAPQLDDTKALEE